MKSSTVNGTSGEESIKRRNIIKYPTKKEMDRKHKIEMENIRRDSLAKENRKKMINEGISAKIKAEAEKASNDSKIPE
ncbi:MAG: hypothetical protein LBI37_00655 [Puniceicoccales bacterium]|nr:hypothetical protein [Puniceicoccales bacterium]